MGPGLVEDTVKWHRRGADEPWLRDSFMAELSAEAIGRLERHATLLAEFDQTDWLAADAPVVIVLSGTVRVYRVRRDGHVSIDRITGIGDLVNVENLFTDPVPMRLGRTSRAQAMAVPRRKFRDLLDSDEEIRQAVVHALAFWLRESTVHRSHSGRLVEQRLWAFLVGLGRRHGKPYGDNVMVDVGLTQADLAAAIGASPKSIEAALQRLRRSGKLSTYHLGCLLHELPAEEAC